MRAVLNPQLKLTEVDIGAIQINRRSRDDIPKLLLGLQYIYVHHEIRDAVFAILTEVAPDRADGTGKVDLGVGRPGMDQWRILVLGTLRLCLNTDYDRLVELANHHGVVRQMLGHTSMLSDLDRAEYTVQAVKDNLRLITPEILGRINEVVVRSGHELVKKKDLRNCSEELATRIDSFVVETNVHYPTDVNLLLDAIRKIVTICGRECEARNWSEWRQYQYNARSFKRQSRKISQLKRANTRDEAKKQAREAEIKAAYREYIGDAQKYVERVLETRAKLENELAGNLLGAIAVVELDRFIAHANRQIDQIRRRVLEGGTIAHEEKVFSIFQEHTEWIAKGKAGVPMELGLKVAVVEDQYRFIVNHRVLEKTEDVAAAIPLIQETQEKYGRLASASFDKGFHSAANQAALGSVIPRLVLPKKGKRNAEELEREGDSEFVRLRKQHAAVESAINALEHHGLDRCLDHGIMGFKRYVALAVLARNVLRVGQILQQHERDERDRDKRRAA
jgi:hypothetical protein